MCFLIIRIEQALEGNAAETEAFERFMHGRVLKPNAQWHKMILPKLMGDMGKYRKYTNTIKVCPILWLCVLSFFFSSQDLLRLVRNKSHHYRDLAVDLQQALGSHPDGYFDYFCSVFPRLFIQAYKFVLGSKYRTEPSFVRYF